MKHHKIVQQALDLGINSENLREWIDAAAALDWVEIYIATKEDSEERGEIADVAEAAYWYASEWHGGQASPEYALLCAVSRLYTPGPCMRTCPDDGASFEIYGTLVFSTEI